MKIEDGKIIDSVKPEETWIKNRCSCCDSCDGNCPLCKFVASPPHQAEEWEKEFDLLYTFRFEDGKENADMIGKAIKVKSFIRSLLLQAKEEVVAEMVREISEYELWAQKESSEQLAEENVMLAYDMNSRQVAAKHIREKVLQKYIPKA